MAVEETTAPAATAKPSRWQKTKGSLSILTSSKIAMVGLAIILFWVLAAICLDATAFTTP